MNGLRKRATLAGTIAATAAGAITVGLVSGVAHSATTATGTSSTTGSTSSTGTATGTSTTTGSSTSSGSSVTSAGQNSQAQGGSHGS